MKLIKINTDHYIVVTDEPIKKGDWYIDDTNQIRISILLDTDYWESRKEYKKITHSTQPLEVKITDEGIHLPDWSKVKALSSRVVKELIGEVDVEMLGYNRAVERKWDPNSSETKRVANEIIEAVKFGYNQALEDNKDRKYTEEDVIRIVEKSRETGLTAEYLIMTFQPKTEWEVEFVDGKLKLI